MEHCVVLSNVTKLITEVNILDQMSKNADAKALSTQVSNLIANWMKTHPNSKLLGLMNVTAPPTS
jgi:hypothetical protein